MLGHGLLYDQALTDVLSTGAGIKCQYCMSIFIEPDHQTKEFHRIRGDITRPILGIFWTFFYRQT